jgi:hypothetical protein
MEQDVYESEIIVSRGLRGLTQIKLIISVNLRDQRERKKKGTRFNEGTEKVPWTRLLNIKQ